MSPALPLAALACAAAFIASLCTGAAPIPPATVLAALFAPDPDSLDHYLVLHQRLPRALIALHAGALLAASGAVLQALARNPLAAPSTLGLTGGAALAVVACSMALALPPLGLGLAAFAGGLGGIAASAGLARIAGAGRDPRGLSLILAGALVSMLCMALANALLLADPARRSEMLGWLAGTVNHAHADRLAALWLPGLAALGVLTALSRPLTLIALGPDKAASAGVPVAAVTRAALGAAALAAAAATAVTGPLAFLGLAVPHLLRPFTGAALTRLIPAAALAGAALCLLADIAARTAFAPYELQAGILLDLAGGLGFLFLVRRLCRPAAGARG
ncbi:iron ABC transporter permease [Mangrovicoccus sp. HB161399]|uniref:FecCD family ABC transporter permease n=1 Tax=Mangrovicoccus sp. HB161399 TaxID=2720392 RepID=UPI001553A53D|nr:iron ABC transporter permease [Mangrovicoccus sp. HB161399]